MATVEQQRLTVLDPTVGEEVRNVEPNPRLDSLKGKRVGLMSNKKPMADIFLAQLGQILGERYGIEVDTVEIKADPSRIASRELLDSLSAKSHAIITGVGD